LVNEVNIKDIDAYGEFTERMWFSGHDPLNPTIERDLPIMGLGLAGEAGEVLEHIKKHLRDGHIDVTELKKELGDAAFYLCRICKFYGLQPSEVLAANVAKLESRRQRGTMRGNGDNR
jgi:NTP pyrophosphatase (non-canonical NTP hydrolase)